MKNDAINRERAAWPPCPRCGSRDVWHGSVRMLYQHYRLHCHGCGHKDPPGAYEASLKWADEPRPEEK